MARIEGVVNHTNHMPSTLGGCLARHLVLILMPALRTYQNLEAPFKIKGLPVTPPRWMSNHCPSPACVWTVKRWAPYLCHSAHSFYAMQHKWLAHCTVSPSPSLCCTITCKRLSLSLLNLPWVWLLCYVMLCYHFIYVYVPSCCNCFQAKFT